MKPYLPETVAPEDVLTTIGIISDTHMPQRWPSLPTAVSQIFANVDIIFHAGDVGELWVLDELSQLAPVIAVHGNDDTADSQRELPYQQIITINGLRILLWHSHYQNRVDEMHTRLNDSLIDGCLRSVARGKSAGAELVIFGHWHIPLIFESEGVTVMNPGALASGNHFRQHMIQTVALLFMLKNGRFHITHVNLAEPERPFTLPTDMNGGFSGNLGIYGRSIISDEIKKLKPSFEQLFYLDPEAFLDVVLPISHQVWAGEKEQIELADIHAAFETADIKPSLRQKFLEALASFV